MKRGEILLIAKSALVREGLKHVLSSGVLSVAREEPTPAGALSSLRAMPDSIDLILYNQSADQNDEIQCLKEISAEFPHVAIAVLAAGASNGGLEAAIEGGARAFLPNSISPQALSLVLQLLLFGENLIATPSELARPLGSAPEAKPRPLPELRVPLSQREAEILDLLKDGAPNKVIARELDVAEATVKVHVKSLLRKIEVGNRTQAAIWAMGRSAVTGKSLM